MSHDYLLGIIATDKGLFRQAVEHFSNALIAGFENDEIYFNLGWAFENIEKYAEAVNAYQKGLLKQDNHIAYNRLGIIYRKLGSEPEARENFMKAVAIAPYFAEARINLAKDNLDELQNLAFVYHDEPLIPLYISNIYFNQNNFADALKAALKVDKLIEDEEVKLKIGSICLKLDDVQNAKLFFQQALRLNHKSVVALINLANMEPDAGYAEKLYKQALNVCPDDFDAHLNYANMLYQNNRMTEALEEYRKAVIIKPDMPETSNNLGIILRDFGEYEEALGLFFNAFIKDNQRKDYAINIYETLLMLGKKDIKTAKKIAKNWLKLAPDNIFARHINNKDNASGEYSKELFDAFANNFEMVMQKIDYNLPTIISQKLGDIKGTIVDLGCGTGLTGLALKNSDNKLIGVDISPAMLEKAKEKNIYDVLVEADVITYCKNLPKADWVIAADLFGYIKDIEQIVANITETNICFSIALGKTENGRYAHNPNKVKKILQKHGYKNIENYNIVLRKENNQDVEGVLFIGRTN